MAAAGEVAGPRGQRAAQDHTRLTWRSGEAMKLSVEFRHAPPPVCARDDRRLVVA